LEVSETFVKKRGVLARYASTAATAMDRMKCAAEVEMKTCAAAAAVAVAVANQVSLLQVYQFNA
jgi:hypothetical protein